MTLRFSATMMAEMERQLAWGSGKPGDEDPLLNAQSDTEAYYGRLSARVTSRGAPPTLPCAPIPEKRQRYGG
jgi:hypothetical protein